MAQKEFSFIDPNTKQKIIVAAHDDKQQAWENKDDQSGWQVPTIDELEAMYEQLHKRGQGNFKNEIYWSSTEFSQIDGWYYDFGKGMDGTALKILYANIRRIKKI